MRTLEVALLTEGDPARLTGGYLFHRRLAELAPECGARLRFISVPARPWPLALRDAPAALHSAAQSGVDVLVLDSIATALVGPWLALKPPGLPLVAMLHQPPGGIDGGRLRRCAQAPLDRLAYRSCRLLLAASASLEQDLLRQGLAPTRLRVVPPGRDVAPAPVGDAPHDGPPVWPQPAQAGDSPHDGTLAWPRPTQAGGALHDGPLAWPQPAHAGGSPHDGTLAWPQSLPEAAPMAPGIPGDPSSVAAPDTDRAAQAERRVDLRRGKASFLCVGNWMRRKGIHDLLEAFARLPEDSGSLHLAGDTDIEPAYASRLRQRLAQADLAGRVVVHGVLPLAEISRLYAAADVFVLPSYREPYGTVYGEAMAMGLPVVGWRAGNLPFLAEDGREGVLLPPGDVPGLASALLALAQDERWRQRLGAAALARALRRPTWRETAGLFFGALREVVAEAHEPVPGRGSSRPAQAPGDS